MGGIFSSQSNTSQNASQGSARGASQGSARGAAQGAEVKPTYIYNTQKDIIHMSPDDIKNLSFKEVNPKIDGRFGGVDISKEQEDAMNDLLYRQSTARYDFDGSLMKGGKRRRKTRKIRRRKSRKI
jgi:hypothetical protein